MKMVSLTVAICLLAFMALKAHGLDDRSFNQTDAEDYLEKYGYLNGMSRRSGVPHQRELARARAISDFQRFAHLPVTGELDARTRKAMLAPRCGQKDVGGTKRGGVGPRWDIGELNWAFDKQSAQLSSGTIRTAIKQALDIWSKVIPLNFIEVSPQSKQVDLQFGFASGNHDNCGAFDGEGGVLAHAYFPQDGRLHFDDGEKWAFNDGKKVRDEGYIDLLSVVVHELGHALGLPHVDSQQAIMYPMYIAPEVDSNGQIKPFGLNQIDIQNIQKLYGPRGNGPPTKPPRAPLPTPTGAACPRFDTALTALDGSVYFFSGNVGWKKPSANAPANSATPFYIDEMFKGVASTGITAAVSNPLGYNLLLVFQGRKVFWFTWNERRSRFGIENNYPMDLPNDIPFTPEGAFLSGSYEVILYRGDQYITYDFYGNKAQSGVQSLSQRFGTLPNTKASFFVEADKLNFLDANNAYFYDLNAKKVVNTKPVKQVITC